MKIIMNDCSMNVELERKECTPEFEGGDVINGNNQTVQNGSNLALNEPAQGPSDRIELPPIGANEAQVDGIGDQA